MRYDVADDGALSGGGVFYDMTDAPGEDAIDGIKVDAAGNVYVCGPGGVWVLSPAGEHLGTSEAARGAAQPRLGRRDGRTLYITALTSVYRLRLGIPGIRPS